MTLPTDHLKPKSVPKGSMTFAQMEQEWEQAKIAQEMDFSEKYASPFLFVDVGGSDDGKYTNVLQEIVESERIPGILRKVTRPKWYNRTPWGTPRLVDIKVVRSLASHVVFQSCVLQWQSDIQSSDYEIIIDDKDLLEDPFYNNLKDLVERFCEQPNPNINQGIKDVFTQMIKDILEIDAGVGVKSFPIEMHETFDMGEEFEKGELRDPIERFQSFVPMDEEPTINFMAKGEDRVPLYLAAEDAGSFLKQFDLSNQVVGYWQHPFETTSGFQSSAKFPRIFSNREVIFMETNKPTYDNYGWSRAQMVFDILKFMIATILNTGKYAEKGALPPGLVNVIGLGKKEFNAFASHFRNRLQGNPHSFGLISTPKDGEVKFVPFNFNMDDIILLNPMQFYWKMIMAACQVSASELNITDSVNKATEQEQNKKFRKLRTVVIHNRFERMMNMQIIRQEFDPTGIVKFQWVQEEDIVAQKTLQEIRTLQLQNGERTINEFRNEDGLEPLDWGDLPFEIAKQNFNFDLEGTVTEREEEDSFFIQEEEEEVPIDEEEEGNLDEVEDEEIVEVTEDDEKLLINEEFITYNISKRSNDFLKKEEDDKEERKKKSKKIDKLVEQAENNIYNAVLDTVKSWLERVIDLFRSRFSSTENIDISPELKDVIDSIIAPGLEQEELKQSIMKQLVETFKTGVKATNEFDIDDSIVGINFNVLPQKALDFLETNSLIAAESLSDKTEKDIRNAIIYGIRNGENISSITSEIMAVSDKTQSEARMVAQTESITAFAQGRKTAFQQAGKNEFIFYAHLDNRVCSECEKLHEKVFNFDKDKDKLPTIHPNCRCTILSVEED